MVRASGARAVASMPDAPRCAPSDAASDMTCAPFERRQEFLGVKLVLDAREDLALVSTHGEFEDAARILEAFQKQLLLAHHLKLTRWHACDAAQVTGR